MKKIFYCILITMLLVFNVNAQDVNDLANFNLINQSYVETFKNNNYNLEQVSEDLSVESFNDKETFSIDTNISLEESLAKVNLSTVYDYNQGNVSYRGSELSYLTQDEFESKKYASLLSSIITKSDNKQVYEIHNLISTFVKCTQPSLSDENIELLVNQIIAQSEINNYFIGNKMISYARNSNETNGYDEATDLKAAICHGKKYLVSALDNGFIISVSDTDKEDNIVIDALQKSEIIINKDYALKNISDIITGILKDKFTLYDGENKLSVNENIDKDIPTIYVAGNGLLLSFDDMNKTYMSNTQDNKTTLEALSSILSNFKTLDSYAKMTGASGIKIITYFDTGIAEYTSENIAELSSILTTTQGKEIEMKDDSSLNPEVDSNRQSTNIELNSIPVETNNILDDSENLSDNEALEPKEINDDEQLDDKEARDNQEEIVEEEKENSTQQLKDDKEPQIISETAKKLEVKGKKVNVRETPEGKVIFRVKSKDILDIVGDTIEQDGAKWYNVEYKGKKGYIRHDTIKLLDNDIYSEKVEVEEANDANIGVLSELKLGSSGDSVTTLQKKLKELGFLKGKADGKYGKKTSEAVEKAQASFNMSQTGIADNAFQSILYSTNTQNNVKVDNNVIQTKKIDVEALRKAYNYLKSKYQNKISGYNCSFAFYDSDEFYSLVANFSDDLNTNIEISISVNNAEGLNINPKYDFKFINLNLRDVDSVQLSRGKTNTELSPEFWRLNDGFVDIDLANSKEARTLLLDTRVTKDIIANTTLKNYNISMDGKSPVLAVLKYMDKLWDDMGLNEIANISKYSMPVSQNN